MQRKTFQYLSIFASVFIVLSFGSYARAGFGISPAGITLDGVLRGTKIEKVIVLSRSDPKEDLLISAEISGDTAKWIELERGTKFTYLAGNKQFPVKVWINIPNTTANGEYTGTIKFIGGASQSCVGENCTESSVGVGVSIGALADIKISVTDQEIKKFRILGIQVDKAKAGEKLSLVLFVENSGNVDIQPDHIIVDIFDKFHRVQLGSFTVSQFDGKISPQNSGPIRATVPWIPDLNNYWAEVSVFDQKNQLLTKENIAFETEAGKPSVFGSSGNVVLYIIIGALGGALILLCLSFVFFTRYFKKNLQEQIILKEKKNYKLPKDSASEISGVANEFEGKSVTIKPKKKIIK
ncbi:MAG: hypothetical protein WC242_00765 [Candidatus Paceibacterota bacterium]|jgi:hypothetical protein